MGPAFRGDVIVSSSHGAPNSLQVVLDFRPAAAIFHEAGRCREDSALDCLDAFQRSGVPCAVVGTMTARIGDADDMLAEGRIAETNAIAEASGVRRGMSVRDAAARLLERAEASVGDVQGASAAERAGHSGGEFPGVTRAGDPENPIILMNASTAMTEDLAGAVVVSSSHGALNSMGWVLRFRPGAAFFHEAGRCREDSALLCLEAFADRNIPCVMVATMSARIGDAADIYEHGVVADVNGLARARGIAPGTAVKAAARALASAR
jgi:nucleotidyltransferase/DNA polymerase involved in DNA repair